MSRFAVLIIVGVLIALGAIGTVSVMLARG